MLPPRGPHDNRSTQQLPTSTSVPAHWHWDSGFGIWVWDLGLGLWGFVMDLTLGARLRARREQQQVALAAIAEETKISVALLEGLERDDVTRWPGGLFRRAYIRAYAQKIGLDPEEVVREFIQRYPDPVAEASPVEAMAQAGEGKRPKTRLGLMIAGLAALRAQRQDAAKHVATPELHVEEPQRATDTRVQEPPRADHTRVQEPARVNHTRVYEPPRVNHTRVEARVEQRPAEPARIEILRVEEAPPEQNRLMLEPEPPGQQTGELPRPAKVLQVPSPDRRDVVTMARVCTRIACARDDRDLAAAIEEAVGILDAQGAILWTWDSEREALSPVLAYGYPDEVLARVPDVGRTTDNAIAVAFRFGQARVVRGSAHETGAFVAPLLTPGGCVGALALEFADGGEQSDFAQALATIVSAQLSTVFAGTPQAAIDEWEQRDRSFVVAS